MSTHPYQRYNLSELDKARLAEWHYHKPNGETEQPERYQEINLATKAVAELLMKYCPPSRQLSLALTKLEEARMWANNAIAMEK
jgi:hypothetical protein